jgi:N-succinyldiaminopimelate aminotransferase
MSITANRVATFGTTIFTEINMLAQQHNALNLGQGKPDFDAPPNVVEQLVRALHAGHYNQYAPGPGSMNLRTAVAHHAERFYGMSIHPVNEVIVTAGATEGILAAILGLVDAGDEVIIIEPFYDSYLPGIIMANATPVFVSLHAPDWTFDEQELRAAFTKKTRALILNTPHNPTGRVFTREELTLISTLCLEHDVTVISDEVYEHLLFDDAQHIPIATLPGMFDHCVTVSSAGKLFSATGWKIGWVYGHAKLIEGVDRAHQFITFAVHHPTQEAIAYALNQPDTYYHDFRTMYQRKRDILEDALSKSGLSNTTPQGTYFVMANYTNVFEGTPVEFTRHLIQHIGVACIPPESFYGLEHVALANGYVRFAFCKSDEMLRQAEERLAQLTR